jgi:uncharacterized protein
MKIIVFGATGRVGSCVVEQAAAAGYEVTAFVRDSKRAPQLDGVSIATGDALSAEDVHAALSNGFDAVVSGIGIAGGLAKTTLVTDATRIITEEMKMRGIARYLAVSGVAEMTDITAGGKVTNAILKATPIGNAIRDHDGAFAIVRASGLDWTLAGCGYIKSGPRRNEYSTSVIFPGGFKVIHPPDVADFLVHELSEHKYAQKVVGVWY